MQKVLIVDNSALMRRKICDIINTDKDFQVSEMSMNTQDAYNKIVENAYAIVVIGLSARMDVLTFMRQLQTLENRPRVIFLTSSIAEDMQTIRQAMSLGAYDYVYRENRLHGMTDKVASELLRSLHNASRGLPAPKRAQPVDPYEATKRVREMVQRVSQKLDRSVDTTVHRDVDKDATATSSGMRKDTLIALACSTGGPQALQVLIPMLPADLPVPLVLVQHMPAGFTDSLARRLDQTSAIHVKQAEDQEVLRAGWVYIAPGGKHMEIGKDRSGRPMVSLNDKPPIGSLKPCADLMYESLCHSDYKEILCVVLTGMGADGTKGIQMLKKHKKIYVISESQDTCVVYGMPRSIEQQGLSDKVVPINQIADAIIKKLGD